MTLAVAATMLALEGLAALGLGGYVAVETIVGSPSDRAGSIGVAAFGVLVGAGLLWVAYGVLRALRWSRGPGVVTQIFALPLGWTLLPNQQAIGIVVIAAAAVVLLALLAPQTTEALMGDR
ncbi:hypothetical protein J5X84_10335 [Streptosporangiaceae bacterium NEAU-GS5]|nr:hypothetical protein [Streptosporangiaceae bacterium NEAU-GS5]